MKLSEVEFRNCNQNSAKNFNRIDIGTVTLWFSYETIIAFHTPDTGFVATENIWGNTTGKHLNWICNKEDRLPRAEFLDKLNSININFSIEE